MISKILAKIFVALYRNDKVKAYLRRDLYGSLFRPDNSPYMLRYAVVRVGTRASKVLSFLTRGKYDHVRLHVILQADLDREFHNHPFNYRTFVLDGWYSESMPPGSVNIQGFIEQTDVLCAGDTKRTLDGHFHRIAAVPKHGVTTLFCMGKDTGGWGFLVDGAFMPSKEFFARRKIKANGVADT